MRYKATGNYESVNGTKRWTSVSSTSVSEHSSNGWAELDRVNYCNGTLGSNGAYIKHNSQFVIQHYIPLFLGGKLFRIPTHEQTVTGSTYFYASSIQ